MIPRYFNCWTPTGYVSCLWEVKNWLPRLKLARGIQPLWLERLFEEYVHARCLNPEIQVYRNWSLTLKMAAQHSALHALSMGMALHHEIAHLCVILRNEVHELELRQEVCALEMLRLQDKFEGVTEGMQNTTTLTGNCEEENVASPGQHELRWHTKNNKAELLNTLGRQTFKPYTPSDSKDSKFDEQQTFYNQAYRNRLAELANVQQAAADGMRGSTYSSFMNTLNQQQPL